MRIVRRTALAVLALALSGVLLTGVTLWAQGYRVYVVHTGSMSPAYQPGDVVVDRPAGRHYRTGQVITFRHSAVATDVVTHRVTEITRSGLIHTKGDANRTPDAWSIHPDQVKGSVMFGVRGMGYVLVFLQQSAGVASLALAAMAVLLLWTFFFPGGAAEDVAERPAARHRLRFGMAQSN